MSMSFSKILQRIQVEFAVVVEDYNIDGNTMIVKCPGLSLIERSSVVIFIEENYDKKYKATFKNHSTLVVRK